MTPSTDDIPSYGTVSYGSPLDRPGTTAPDELECLKERTIDRLGECIARFAGQIARDWAHCGKAACARSRRCRGFACQPRENAE
jgi:hypothetical protein